MVETNRISQNILPDEAIVKKYYVKKRILARAKKRVRLLEIRTPPFESVCVRKGVRNLFLVFLLTCDRCRACADHCELRWWHAHHHSAGTGHLYQDHFKSFIIQRDEYLLTVCCYVERNAVRADLVERAVNWRRTSLWRHRGRPQKYLDRKGS